jgi:hypothetical protein
MILFRPLEDAVMDLERSVINGNLKVFLSEYERCRGILKSLPDNKAVMTLITPSALRGIEEYYATRIRQLRRRMGLYD